jgi:hypothetical protein
MRRIQPLLILAAIVTALLASFAGAASATPGEASPSVAKPEPWALSSGLSRVPVITVEAQRAVLPGAERVDGPYLIVSIWNNKCLDRDNTNPNNGAKVQLWDCNGQPQQHWYFHYLNGQNYLIENGLGRVLDAYAPCVGSDGCKVQIWEYVPGNLNQVWWLWSDPFTGWDRYQSAATSNMQLDADTNGGGANGNKVQLWHYIDNQVNQTWGVA